MSYNVYKEKILIIITTYFTCRYLVVFLNYLEYPENNSELCKFMKITNKVKIKMYIK